MTVVPEKNCRDCLHFDHGCDQFKAVTNAIKTVAWERKQVNQKRGDLIVPSQIAAICPGYVSLILTVVGVSP